MCKKFTIIGISDSHRQFFPPKVLEIIGESQVFSGGKRHHEIMEGYLPPESEWIDVIVPLKNVFEKYKKHLELTVFASGDPLFFGYAATLRREFPDAEIKVYPAFNSIQMLAHRINLPYQDMINVSLTGRPWKNLDDALIMGCPLIGVLTDKIKSPDSISRRMLEYGYDNYEMTVGTCLGNEEEENIEMFSPTEASDKTFKNPNCIILRQIFPKKRYFGIPESEFYHLDGREKMITKMPIRLLSLSMLDLHQRKSFWDIGFCTGSVSIEARLQFPHLRITSFEVREESRELMEKNCHKFGAPDIEYIIGDFLKSDISGYERPDAVFIGGHGGKLHEMLEKLRSVMLQGCVVVFNSVSHESCELFRKSVEDIGIKIIEEHTMALDSYNPITILKAQ